MAGITGFTIQDDPLCIDLCDPNLHGLSEKWSRGPLGKTTCTHFRCSFATALDKKIILENLAWFWENLHKAKCYRYTSFVRHQIPAMLEGRSLENVWHFYHTKPWPSCSRPIPSRQQNPKRDNHEILIGFMISWSIPPELHGFLKKFQDVSNWWSFKKFPGSKPPFFPQHHHVVVGISRFFWVESPPWRQPCRGKMQKCNNFPKKSGLASAQHLHLRHSICLRRHKKSTKKAKGACWHGKKNGFFSRWRAQNCPKMVDYVLFSASFHPFLVAGCFLGPPHLKLPNKQFNTGRGGKRTSMAARSSERVTRVK